MNVRCMILTCTWEGPAEEAVEHGHIHDTAHFEKASQVEAIPAWTVHCTGSCKGHAGFHLVAKVGNEIGCDCPGFRGRGKCRHLKAIVDARFPQFLGDGPMKELDRLIGVMGRILEDTTSAPELTFDRLKQTQRAMRTQLGYVQPPAGKPTPIYAHDTESIRTGEW